MADIMLPDEEESPTNSGTPNPVAPKVSVDPDKPNGPWSSRKFLALMFAMATNKVLLGVGLFVLRDNVEAGSFSMWTWMVTLTVTDGFLSVGGILGLAYVDSYVKVAQLVTPAPKPVE